jgi:micrococcal nuclease
MMVFKPTQVGQRCRALCITLCGAILLLYCAVAQASPLTGKVKAVFDGDTVLLESGERVRYLGIDAPEVAHEGVPGDCYGEQARAANRNWVLGKQVVLKYDRGREHRDHYGRLLAYVALPDGTCINAELLRAGLAWVFRHGETFERFGEFLGYQRDALQHHKGLWDNCPVQEELYYLANQRSWIFHRPDCPLGKAMGRSKRERLPNRRAALEAGFRPCHTCRP